MSTLHGFFNQSDANFGYCEYTTPSGKNVLVTETVSEEGDTIPSPRPDILTDYVGIVLTVVRIIEPENFCEEEGYGEADG
jgi:hypothetical protein